MGRGGAQAEPPPRGAGLPRQGQGRGQAAQVSQVKGFVGQTTKIYDLEMNVN